MNSLTINGNHFSLPIYLPDATLGVVRGLTSEDLVEVGVRGIVVNTYHLMSDPGLEILELHGGIKRFMNFEGLVVSDSGGWQVFSLIHRHKEKGKITDEGVTFSIGGGAKQLFTPEKSIQVQFSIGSDIIICLDDFTAPGSTAQEIQKSVTRTISWAQRSKKEYEKQLKDHNMDNDSRPLLFAVIQGDFNYELRKECAEALLKIGFDGYGYGGYPIKSDGTLDLELSKFVAELIPDAYPKFALGVGKPWDIARLHSYGWNIFDCTLPTRDARHKRLYVTLQDPVTIQDHSILEDRDFYSYVYMGRGSESKNNIPVSQHCKCPLCINHSRSYLHHLFKLGDMSANRLATLHNLFTYSRVVGNLPVC